MDVDYIVSEMYYCPVLITVYAAQGGQVIPCTQATWRMFARTTVGEVLSTQGVVMENPLYCQAR